MASPESQVTGSEKDNRIKSTKKTVWLNMDPCRDYSMLSHQPMKEGGGGFIGRRTPVKTLRLKLTIFSSSLILFESKIIFNLDFVDFVTIRG
jgi:hypothetical protein